MIELPEAATIARQMTNELKGKKIESALRGNAPHKFAFYSRSPEEYAAILAGKTMGAAKEHGSLILASIQPGYTLVLGGGGERILLHESEQTLPKKHQLLLRFQDGACLTVTVSGWGSAQLFDRSELTRHLRNDQAKIPSSSDDFTYDYFQGLFEQLEKEDARSVKYFIISKPGVLGVGNGYLQDILFRAKIHPRHRAIDLTKQERRALYKAIRDTIRQAMKLGGRTTEFDLHNQPGSYARILDSTATGLPCPECGTPIVKISYLGGAAYFCPQCQT